MFTIKGVSKKIDSCAGLISQQAYRTHQKLSAEHKRWVDPEDLVQEALMEAVRAERRYKKNGGAKYSTYLHNGLFYDLRKTYTDRLRLKMRASTGLLELDAPVFADGPERFEVPDKTPTIEVDLTRFKRATNALEVFCRAVIPPVRVAVVKSLLFGRQVDYNERMSPRGAEKLVTLGDQIRSESAKAIAKTGVSWDDFAVFSESEKIRKIALIQLLRGGIVGTVETDARLLECVDCQGTFPLSAVVDGWFVISTMTCGVCYKKLKDDPSSCFGKTKTAERQGYSKKDVECRLHCIDRVICASNIAKGDTVMAKKNVAVEELEDVDFGEETKEDKPVAVKGKAKAAKAEKVAKPKKAKEEDEDAAPAEVGRWPFKNGSLMRWMFQAAYEGISRKDFDKAIKDAGRDPEQWIKGLRAGKNGNKPGANSTHSWTLNEEGGRVKIQNLKYHEKVVTEKAAKVETAKKPAAKAKKVEVKAKAAKKKVAKAA